MKKLVATALLMAFLWGVSAQNGIEKIPLNDDNLSYPEGTQHSFETIDGKNTLVLNGRAQVKNPRFTNGTIEVEVFANQKRSFAGITFRKQDETFEEVYIRMHKSGLPDALQYNPVFNMESNWQLYPEHQAAVITKNEGWNTLKIVVNGDTAEIFVNGKSAMVVPDLKTDHEEGNIGLFALFENRFANLKVSKESEVNLPEAEESNTIEGLITEWNLSVPSTFDGKTFPKNVKNVPYMTKGQAETSGLLTVSKYVTKPSRGKYRRNNEDYVVAGTTINSTEEIVKHFYFDYSDRIMVYLNGELLYSGNNGFLFKNPQYEGHLKLETNMVTLPLKKGANELQCVVIERANGWGLMGRLTD
ncbi:family 16 glycoside hydrolase [Ulvibacterium marinum]|uniref:DUF1080 domain-containing protein n=1 Tax=Ulvibacterium marinum TaxID=2419782 RepID=A0A3B0CGN1_9FLAO|nr:family 16 glycoside hydrolase [Ulvibacterium marinum]RKN83539.1 DUF1080 domain-containing protein [Ulvibacterium marinum]